MATPRANRRLFKGPREFRVEAELPAFAGQAVPAADNAANKAMREAEVTVRKGPQPLLTRRTTIPDGRQSLPYKNQLAASCENGCSARLSAASTRATIKRASH